MERNQSTKSSVLKAICLMVSLVMSISVFALSASQKQNPQQSDDKVYERVEVMPSYPGGVDGIMSFISKNIRYPQDAKDAGLQGIVICEFVINKDGSFSNMKVKRGVSPSLDQEAMRVIKSFPKWKPGTNGGKPVRVLYTLPVAFRIR